MNDIHLTRRQFYRRLSIRVCVAVIILLALIGGAAYFAVWTQHFTPQDNTFSNSFVRGAGVGAVGGVCVVALPLLWRILAKPILVLDEIALRIGNVKLNWDVISEVYPTRYRGARFVAVRTLNDDNALRRLPKVMAAAVNVRRRTIGALFAIPEVRGIDTNALIELIRTYQAAALNGKERDLHETPLRQTSG